MPRHQGRIAAGLGPSAIERRLPFGALLGLRPPLAANRDDRAIGPQLREQIGHLRANCCRPAQILDQQIRQDLWRGIDPMMLRITGNAVDQINQDQQPRLQRPVRRLRAQRLDPVVDLPQDQLSRQRHSGKTVVQEIARDRDAERAFPIALDRIEADPQLAAQRCTETRAVEFGQDPLPEAPPRRQDRPVGDIARSVGRGVSERRPLQMAIDFAGPQIEHLLDLRFGGVLF
ncbi:MAG: hypothetical protein AB7H90_21855 [Alphaproteobacteria bacterium]